MKRILQIVLSAGGGLLIGLFANRLNNVVGCLCFGLGVVLLTFSIAMLSGSDPRH